MQKKITHPLLVDLTAAQRRAFEGHVLCDPMRSRHPKTIAALVAAGLLAEETKSEQTRLGTFTWVDHYVPLRVHMAYHVMVEWDEDGNIIAVK